MDTPKGRQSIPVLFHSNAQIAPAYGLRDSRVTVYLDAGDQNMEDQKQSEHYARYPF